MVPKTSHFHVHNHGWPCASQRLIAVVELTEHRKALKRPNIWLSPGQQYLSLLFSSQLTPRTNELVKTDDRWNGLTCDPLEEFAFHGQIEMSSTSYLSWSQIPHSLLTTGRLPSEESLTDDPDKQMISLLLSLNAPLCGLWSHLKDIVKCIWYSSSLIICWSRRKLSLVTSGEVRRLVGRSCQRVRTLEWKAFQIEYFTEFRAITGREVVCLGDTINTYHMAS